MNLPILRLDKGVVRAGLREGEAEKAELRVGLEKGQEVLGLHVVLARQVEGAHLGKHIGISQEKFCGTEKKIQIQTPNAVSFSFITRGKRVVPRGIYVLNVRVVKLKCNS